MNVLNDNFFNGKIVILWDATLYSPLQLNRRFGGKCRVSRNKARSKAARGRKQAELGDSMPGGSKEPFLHSVQIGSGAHPASYPIGIWPPFRGIKQPGRKADLSSPSSAETMNESFPSTLSYVVISWCLIS
jgi:hypothetical protein